MTTRKRLFLSGILFIGLLLVMGTVQAKVVYAQQARPLGSCGDTVSDDAQLFGNRIADVVNQAKTFNQSLQADTHVVTVSPDKLAGRSLKAYSDYIQSQCPAWTGQNTALFILAQGQEPFLHLGSTFSGKITSADFQQMTLGLAPELKSGNYAQGTIDLLKQVQKKLSPDYSWLWITLAVVLVLIAGIVVAVLVMQRRRAAGAIATAREQATQAKQVAVNAISPLSQEIEELSPRIEVLQALIPAATANQLRGLFENAREKTNRVQENLGNLLGNPDTNPNSATLQPKQYAWMQRSYQEVYNEGREPRYLLNAVETAVQRLERNPHDQIEFQQLVAQGYSQGRIARPGYSS